MIKKFLIKTLLLVIASLLFFHTPILSQEEKEDKEGNFDLAYEEYRLNIEEYEKAHDDYVLRRAQYLRFGTQTSRENAYDATKAMLEERDGVVISYLKSLEWRLKEADGLGGSLRDDLLVEIQEEILWHEEHKEDLSSAVTLEDLVKDSDKAKNRNTKNTEDISFKALSYLSYGKYNTLQERLDELLEDLKEKVRDIKEEEREEYMLDEEKLQTIDRWIIESERHIARSKEKKDESLEYAFGTKAKKQVNLGSYNLVLDRLEESRILLRETITFLKELMRQIKIEEVYE